MVDALAHRGPDDRGVVVAGDAVLGASRLSVVDLEHGRQPLHGADRRTVLVCNGEIYGHQAVRRRLPGYPFATDSDCEVALALYEEHGGDFLAHLPGTFALALWDARRRRLLLARDRFGERPLYYATTDDGCLAFASTARALQRAGLAERRVDPGMVGEMLRQGYVPSGRSIWAGVQQLPHAHSLVWDLDDAPLLRRWWSPPPVDESRGVEEAVGWFRRALDAAVQRQLAADVPVGTFLSGGIDSTTVTALAAAHQPGISAFTFDMPGESELPFAEAVAARHDISLHVCRPDDSAVADELLALPEAWDEPFGDSSALPTRMLCRFARERVTSVLTGDGADELLGGYLVWTRGLLPPGVAGAAATTGHAGDAGPPSGPSRRARWRSWTRRSVAPHAPTGASVARRYAAFRQYFDAAELRRLGLAGHDASHVDVSPFGSGTADDICRFDLEHYLPGDVLTKSDRASMAHGLEARAPFLDVEVAEGCLALSADHKVDASTEKLLLRRAFGHLWPDVVAERRKQGFGAPMARWLSLPAVASVAADHLVDRSSALFDLVDYDAVQPYVAANDQRTWNLLVLSIWWTAARTHGAVR